MLPSVAHPPHFQPHHHHLDHQLNFDPLNSPYDLNDPALQARLLRHNDPRQTYHSIPRNRMQYPQPIQRSNTDNLVPGVVSRPANKDEHSLRRKTPNGTLAAGYDGTPGDRAAQPPATKHIIVSSLENGQVLSPRSAHPSDNWQMKTPFDQSPSSYQNYQAGYNYDLSRNNGVVSGMSHGPHGTSWMRSLNHPPGIDSVLNQTLPQPSQQRYYIQNGSIPTVLPATLQPCIGPTASAGVGPYGPYWPDGAYIPYRPAALRDARFNAAQFGNTGEQDATGHYDGVPSLFNRAAVTTSDLFTPGFTWNSLPTHPTRNAQIYKADPLLQHQQQHQQQQHQQHGFAARQPSQKPFETFRDPNTITYPIQPHNAAEIPHQGGMDNLAWHGLPVNTQTPIPDITTRTGTGEFKEKVLSWAHSVYVDLLATIHQSRRNSVSKIQQDGQIRRISKPNIYPKPPRQPGSDFSQQNNVDPTSRRSRPPLHFDSNSTSQIPGASRRFDRPGHDNQYSIHHPVQSHSRFPQLHHNDRSFGQVPHHRSSDTQTLDGFHTLQRATATAPPRMFNQVPNETSTMANAMSALEMLSNLCSESGWEWIDGMLLGGCLAYGLSDYNKAMRWYSRIIARDASHVEAISNLAATLYALDRREEAMQHWLRAVKLRPSYFEAVEHLIGLLCSNQRGKEAVGIIEFVEKSLRATKDGDCFKPDDMTSETESESEGRASSVSTMGSYDKAVFDYDDNLQATLASNGHASESNVPGFGSSGYQISGSENGRMLALIHAKGNMLYALGDNAGAAAAFEDAILIGAGKKRRGIQGLIKKILSVFDEGNRHGVPSPDQRNSKAALLLLPEKALQTAKLVFPPHGSLPGFQYVPDGIARKAAVGTTSNSLLSLAKIYQDGMSSTSSSSGAKTTSGVRDILALYYLSLSLQPSPSTANNVGILLASIQQNSPSQVPRSSGEYQLPDIPGVVPGSGIALALAYYNYGLILDQRHAHLYTNLGSLLKDIGQLPAAIKMYEQAVQCDGNFDIALANLANAVKDSGRINDAIGYYRRAVTANPDFAEAVCGLANALNSVCNWGGRGGIATGHGFLDRWHVDDGGMLRDAKETRVDFGWIKRVVEIVDKQLKDGETWGRNVLTNTLVEQLCQQLLVSDEDGRYLPSKRESLVTMLKRWSGQRWEGSRIVKLVERAIRLIGWQWYQDLYVYRKNYPLTKYARPQLPAGLTAPNAPTVLPFHTFTCPLSAKQIRHISQRNGLRISCSTLRSPWLPQTVYRPPAPPNPHLNVGYVSSDFNNHPLAHLMQSVFGLHNPSRVKAFCYATTASDNSIHRQQIEREAPVFHDASSWSLDRLVEQIVNDGIHILINLNGYTRGARNEVFAARPAPIHMSFMGFAGTLGAEWCDYILADQIAIPPETRSLGRRDVRIEDRLLEEDHGEEYEDWVYGEKIVFTRDSFFCCDHRQSAPDSQDRQLGWEQEQENRWKMRKELFPTLSDDAIILGNFNQLYKVSLGCFGKGLSN